MFIQLASVLFGKTSYFCNELYFILISKDNWVTKLLEIVQKILPESRLEVMHILDSSLGKRSQSTC